jgi:hypothetical protein
MRVRLALLFVPLAGLLVGCSDAEPAANDDSITAPSPVLEQPPYLERYVAWGDYAEMGTYGLCRDEGGWGAVLNLYVRQRKVANRTAVNLDFRVQWCESEGGDCYDVETDPWLDIPPQDFRCSQGKDECVLQTNTEWGYVDLAFTAITGVGSESRTVTGTEESHRCFDYGCYGSRRTGTWSEMAASLSGTIFGWQVCEPDYPAWVPEGKLGYNQQVRWGYWPEW